jgi:hypothetical protein
MSADTLRDAKAKKARSASATEIVKGFSALKIAAIVGVLFVLTFGVIYKVAK